MGNEPVATIRDVPSVASGLAEPEYHVFERQGFDKVMQTVAGDSSNESARKICEILELYEVLSSNREKIGYLVCDQKSDDRFGNRTFQSMIQGYIRQDSLPLITAQILGELGSNDERVVRKTIPALNKDNSQLELSASLIKGEDNIAVFVARKI
mmetsp:Transcript_11246/g.15848  ORF Transcript_11246/g.15848 Transcript_11246/m.15848 type:complete len:154 (+) Transcript_11246:2425-2886(+)